MTGCQKKVIFPETAIFDEQNSSYSRAILNSYL